MDTTFTADEEGVHLRFNIVVNRHDNRLVWNLNHFDFCECQRLRMFVVADPSECWQRTSVSRYWLHTILWFQSEVRAQVFCVYTERVQTETHIGAKEHKSKQKRMFFSLDWKVNFLLTYCCCKHCTQVCVRWLLDPCKHEHCADCSFSFTQNADRVVWVEVRSAHPVTACLASFPGVNVLLAS